MVGFASLSPYKERAAYRTTVEDSVYVDRDRNGQGIGRLLLDARRRRRPGLRVPRRDGPHRGGRRRASRALHARCGFELVGIEREVGRKFNRWLDVAVMQLAC